MSVAVNHNTVFTELGGGRFNLKQGRVEFYPKNGLWLPVELSSSELSKPFGTHYYDKARASVAIDAPSGRIRLYPEKIMDEYIEFYDPAGKKVNVSTSPGEVVITRTVANWSADIKFTFNRNGMKKEIIFENIFDMPKKVTLGFRVRGLMRDGRRIIKDGKVLMVLPGASWVDSNPDEDALKGGQVAEVIDDHLETATMTIPKAAMTGAVYPVKVDPSAIFQPADGDTQLLEPAPDNNLGADPIMRIRSQNAGRNGRILYKSDFSSQVLVGSIIDIGTLTLNADSVQSLGGGRTHIMSRSTVTNWVPGTSINVPEVGASCWNDRLFDPVTPTRWTGGGVHSSADWTTDDQASTLITGTGDKDWDVKAMIQTALDTVGGVIHLVGRDASESSSATRRQVLYRSSEHATPGTRPLLDLTWTVPAGGQEVLMGGGLGDDETLMGGMGL